MKVTIEEIKRLQTLSALSSSDEELQNLIKDFEGIAQFVDQICDANLDDINVKNKCVTIDFGVIGKKALSLDYAPITFVDD